MGKLKHKKLLSRIVSCAMACAMVLTGISISPATAKAATGPVATAITSIAYDITVSGVSDETSLTWTSQDSNWQSPTVTLPLKGDGDYTFTAEYSSVAGLKNMGYFAESNNEALTITINKMVVNGTYSINPGVTLKPGVADENGSKSYNALKNIWGGLSDGQVLYGDENKESAFFAYDKTNDTIYFYTIGEIADVEPDDEPTDGPVATALNSIVYDLTISGVKDETSLSWTSQDGGWTMHTVTLPLDGDGHYTLDTEYDSISGFKNMGFFAESDNEDLAITVNSMLVNGTYTIDLGVTLTPGVADANGSKSNNALKNIWGGFSDGDKIYTSEKSYFGYDGTSELIRFYAPKEELVSSQSSVPVRTDVYSIEYVGKIDGADGAGSFEWNAVTTGNGWGSKTVTVDYEGNGALDFTVDFSDVPGSIINLGYVTKKEGSPVTLTINQIIVNDYYTLDFTTSATLREATQDGLTNMWSFSEDCLIAEDAFGLASLKGVYADNYQSTIQFWAPSVSQYYVLSMGDGWNLGNSFDGLNTDTSEADLGETAWGNPVVTKELIAAVAAKGYDSIRMPMTLERRYSEVDGTYVIDTAWLARYKEVVDYATELGLHVMINIHHDSWIWLANWDGDESSEEYVKFTQLWQQLAEYFKDESYLVSFETINEPYFDESVTTQSQQTRLDAINLAAYNIIRKSGGKNDKRIIVMPTLSTNAEKSEALYKVIVGLDDPYVVATVHYYSEWVYSANLGVTGFDDVLWYNNSEPYTARDSVDVTFSNIYDTFTKNGIGVIVGEYGLLGYDAGEQTNQAGEELKYYDYVNYVAKEKGICLMFWDNGSGIDRNDTTDYSWKKAKVGAALEAALNGERSSYATGLDTIYLNSEADEDVSIPLTLNGNTFKGVSDANGALSDSDYTYDEASATLTLSKDYVNRAYASLGESYGQIADLTLSFSAGAAWHEYLVKYGTPESSAPQFTTITTDGYASVNGVTIPFDFKGADVRRVTAYQDGNRVGPNSSWWSWLQKDSSYSVTADSLKLLSSFFDDSVSAGELELSIEMYDGQTVTVTLTIPEKTKVQKKDTTKETEQETTTVTENTATSGTTAAAKPAKKGTLLKDKTTKATYKVTSAASAKTHTVTYMGTTSASKKSITIPESVKINGVTYKVTAIAANALKGNTKVTSVTIGKNVKTIGKNAFSGCRNLKTVTFQSGSKLTKIGAKAFYKCTSLKKISIPSKVKTIDTKAFYGCAKLSKVTFASKSALKTVDKDVFYKCSSLKKLALPSQTKVSK
jgi:endoglucanase